MLRLLCCLLVLVVAAGGTCEAAKAKNKKHGNPKPLPYSKNDEMVRPDSTPQAWSDQADQIQALGDTPHFTGYFMWRGRADREYLPFHQWEVRLAAGESDRKELTFRLDALGPDMKPLLGRKGHVVKLGTLRQGKDLNLSYKLNTSAPASTRVTLTWAGGEETYVATTGHNLPVPQSAMADVPNLLVMQPFFEYKAKKKYAIVQFMVRNDGGKPAEEVVHTIHFLDKKGKTVHTHEYIPEKGTLEPGYAKDQSVSVKKCPPFSTIRITTRKKESEGGAGGLAIDPGRFTASRAVEVAEFKIVDGVLHATVRNGTGAKVPGLALDLQLYDSAGAVLKEVSTYVGDMAVDARTPVQAAVGEVAGVAGWGFGYATGAPAPAGQSAPTPVDDEDASPQASMNVNGIRFDVMKTVGAGGMVKIKSRFTNTTATAMSGLTCVVTVKDGSATGTATVAVGDLGAGASWDGSFVVDGVASVQQVGLEVKFD